MSNFQKQHAIQNAKDHSFTKRKISQQTVHLKFSIQPVIKTFQE